MKLKRSPVSTGVLAALGSVLLFTALPALAQPERIEITGSLIRRIEGESALPVVTLRLEELRRSGVTNAEELVKFIVQQQGGSVTSGSVSGTNGAASYADLRSLGPGRTLVLLNGKRIVSNPFSSIAVDLNSLPLAAIERVETLPDGASATYGTDAIAGVINFITRKNFQGGSIGADAKVTQEGGGDIYSGTLLAGFGDMGVQGWNVLGGLNVRQQRPMRGTEREFSRTSFIPARGFNGTSPTAFPANYSQSRPGVSTPVIAGTNPTAPNCDPPGSIVLPGVPGGTARCFADTQIYTQTVPDQEQASVFLRAGLALGKDHSASLEFFHSKNTVTSLIAPSPEGGLLMNASSPFYPGNGITPITNTALDRTLPISIAWRTVPLGSRSGQQENNTQRVVAALEGTLVGWDYSASLLWSNSKVVNDFLNGYPTTVGLRNGVSGCAVALTAAGVCSQPLANPVWLNPFGAQTAAGLAYLQSIQVLGRVQDGEGTLQSMSATASRTLGSLAGGPIALAIGTEFRTEEMVYNTDVPKVSQAASSGLAGSGATRAGDRDITAVALELSLPVLKTLEIGASVRADKYSDFGNTVNPKFSLRWRPTTELLVRGSYNTGFTAPSLTSLYSPNATTFTGNRYSDPLLCPNGVPGPNAVPARDCNIQFQRLTGGNTKLTAEKSKAWTLGFVAQPSSTFSFGADYWQYYIQDSVSTIGDASIFADPAKYAGLFVRCSQDTVRGPTIGACNTPGGGDPLAYVIDTNQNLGDVRTSGVDVQANWNSGPLPEGRFSVGVRGSYVHKYEFQVEPNGRWFNPVGNFNAQFNVGGTSGGPVIRYQQITNFGWEKAAWSFNVAHRFMKGYRDQNNTSAPFNVAPFNTNQVGDYEVFDASIGYTGFKGLTLRAGVLNAFNTDPPFSNQTARFQARGYDDRFHNPLGRTWQLSAKYDF